jgi:hypothetical protein
MTPPVAEPEPITAFFARYTGYLTTGDLDGLANIYNYLALAITAAGCLAVTEPQQTRDFFAQGQTFYRSHHIHGVVTTPLDACQPDQQKRDHRLAV